MPREAPFRIDFKQAGNSGDYVQSGWFEPEPNGTWTWGVEARLRLPRPADRGGYRCEMKVRPLVNAVRAPQQALTIQLGSHELYRGSLREGGTVAFAVPAAALDPDADPYLVMRLPDAVSPASIGEGPDIRQLAMFVSELLLFEDAAGEASPKPALKAEPAPAPVRPPPRVAAVTMVYNERGFLPLWLRHYGRQVGLENCFVVDHGSDDGSTEGLAPANRIRVPRTDYNPSVQSDWNSEFCSSLLKWYDWVIYADVDEILVADPAVAATLVDYCRRPLPEVVTAIGLNLAHALPSEPALDVTRPVTEQRSYAFFCSPACKPLLIRRPVKWPGGSHSADAPVAFDHLYNFHLHWFDVPLGLQRLRTTRSMAWARDTDGPQSRVSDDKFIATVQGFANLPKRDDVEFAPGQEPLASWLDRVLASQTGREHAHYRISLDIWPDALWRLPARFVGLF